MKGMKRVRNRHKNYQGDCLKCHYRILWEEPVMVETLQVLKAIRNIWLTKIGCAKIIVREVATKNEWIDGLWRKFHLHVFQAQGWDKRIRAVRFWKNRSKFVVMNISNEVLNWNVVKKKRPYMCSRFCGILRFPSKLLFESTL